MRWDQLFADLEGQLDREHLDEQRALELEEERLRLGRLTLRDRIAALTRSSESAAESVVRIELQGGGVVGLRPLAFGRDWLSAETRHHGRVPDQVVVPFTAIAAILPGREQLEPSLAAVPEASVRLAERIGLPFVLRDLARRRTAVQLTTVDGIAHGTIDRVARDHLDLALHEPGAPRRERDVHGYRIVPLARLLLVRFD
ncbi:hypothetical protein PX701_13750 [Agromyces sp. H3Y2-19a]|uniref:hypothetical protein n=1 Tax=Agromyces chromiiresistens TaxID=3030835 RepID=UPI0023B9EB7D|nr:hypothetical protein [Agromyces chromiiresistens]MDF0514691.1 hypothetical protein [Agromyces chromiiresistens]